MPRLHIDLKKIEYNARLVRELIEPFGLRLVAVTKACQGDGKVAAAMLSGAVTTGQPAGVYHPPLRQTTAIPSEVLTSRHVIAHGIADSRLENIKRVRRRLPGISEENVELLRPPLEAGRLVPNLVYYVTSAEQAEALLAKRPYKYYQMSLCLQVDTGDGREGVPAGQAAAESKKIAELEGAHFMGLATNLACADPAVPLKEALLLFGRAVADVRKSIAGARPPAYSSDPEIRAEQERTRLVLFPPSLSIVSAGGSGLLKLLLELPAAEVAPLFEPLTELRCGEAILLGRVPSGEESELFLPGALLDAFVLEGTILEVFNKGARRRALVGIGVQDIGAGGLAPVDSGIKPVSATSDYLVVELEDATGVGTAGSGAEGGDAASGSTAPAAGGHLSFIPDYYALLGAMISPFVDKIYKGKMV